MRAPSVSIHLRSRRGIYGCQLFPYLRDADPFSRQDSVLHLIHRLSADGWDKLAGEKPIDDFGREIVFLDAAPQLEVLQEDLADRERG